MFRRAAFGLAPLVLAMACSSSSDEAEGPRLTPLEPLTSAKTTEDEMLLPTTPQQKYTDGPNPGLPDALADYLARGFGETRPGAGEPHITRTIDGSAPPPPGENARRLTRFVHLADMQLADDESPTRLSLFDSAGATSSALRPQDAYLCRMANASVRTINALHAIDPIAFTILGGDNADNAQTNEIDWVLGILSGADEVECDSGEDDDPVPGPDNDGKDPFKADGLAMPWKWVTGNHDILVQGNFPIDASNRASTEGTIANGGTRDYREGGAVANGDFVIADPRRALLDHREVMTKVAAHDDGHGLGEAERTSGKATYTFDVEGTPIRFLVIDTAHENGGSNGVIRQSEVDRVIKPALDAAEADGKWVILSSHHATTSLGDGTGLGGKPVPDALTTEQWESFVARHPHVLFSLTGHSHRHRVKAIAPDGGHPFWEVLTSAIADYPHQFRVIEIFDQDNGWIMMRATCVDFSVEGDPVAADGRARGVVDYTSGWLPKEPAEAHDRNVELWIEKP